MPFSNRSKYRIVCELEVVSDDIPVQHLAGEIRAKIDDFVQASEVGTVRVEKVEQLEVKGE